MFFYKFYRWLTTMVALVCVCAVGLLFYATDVGKLGELSGERVFYLDDASSQGVRKEELSLFDIFRVEGESVRFDRNGEREEVLFCRIKDCFDARVLFSERVCGVTSYYCYTDDWQNGVDVGGVTVNLHVAISETDCVVGTPIIFDGF